MTTDLLNQSEPTLNLLMEIDFPCDGEMPEPKGTGGDPEYYDEMLND